MSIEAIKTQAEIKAEQMLVITMAGSVITQDPILSIQIGGIENKIKPVLVGNMYRISTKANTIVEMDDFNGVLENIYALSSIVSIILKNTSETPNQDEIEHCFQNLSAPDLFLMVSSTIGSQSSSEIKKYYLDPSEPFSGKQDKSIGQMRRDALPHTLLGSFCKYFKINLNEVLWSTSWDNMTLMLSAIEKQQPEEYDENGKKKRVDASEFFGENSGAEVMNNRYRYPVKDAWDVF
ncbi:MAG: hypothetical protein EOO20_06255 [Chryseobacterium sp.]|nr:MAG: hypothetical protein EOO20_06255 [Chryseobacterium sp.]